MVNLIKLRAVRKSITKEADTNPRVINMPLSVWRYAKMCEELCGPNLMYVENSHNYTWLNSHGSFIPIVIFINKKKERSHVKSHSNVSV